MLIWFGIIEPLKCEDGNAMYDLPMAEEEFVL